MTSGLAGKAADVLIVASGALITLLIAGAVLYWIGREWRSRDAPQPRERGASIGLETSDEADPPPTNQSSGS